MISVGIAPLNSHSRGTLRLPQHRLRRRDQDKRNQWQPTPFAARPPGNFPHQQKDQYVNDNFEQIREGGRRRDAQRRNRAGRNHAGEALRKPATGRRENSNQEKRKGDELKRYDGWQNKQRPAQLCVKRRGEFRRRSKEPIGCCEETYNEKARSPAASFEPTVLDDKVA